MSMYDDDLIYEHDLADEPHPSDLYCGICGLDYPCGEPSHGGAMYSPPADYLDDKPTAE